jgi:hypothetical protein
MTNQLNNNLTTELRNLPGQRNRRLRRRPEFERTKSRIQRPTGKYIVGIIMDFSLYYQFINK